MRDGGIRERKFDYLYGNIIYMDYMSSCEGT